MSAPKIGSPSPWGPIQHIDRIPGGDGIVAVMTAGHGGYWVPPESRGRISVDGRAFGKRCSKGQPGWFEEDWPGCYVVIAFPASFNLRFRERAQAVILGFESEIRAREAREVEDASAADTLNGGTDS